MVAYLWRRDLLASRPTTVQNQPIDSLGMSCSPVDNNGHTERTAHEVEFDATHRRHDGVNCDLLQLQRPPTLFRSVGHPAAGSVVAHQSSSVGEGLEKGTFRSKIPAQLQMAQPTTHKQERR